MADSVIGKSHSHLTFTSIVLQISFPCASFIILSLRISSIISFFIALYYLPFLTFSSTFPVPYTSCPPTGQLLDLPESPVRRHSTSDGDHHVATLDREPPTPAHDKEKKGHRSAWGMVGQLRPRWTNWGRGGPAGIKVGQLVFRQVRVMGQRGWRVILEPKYTD